MIPAASEALVAMQRRVSTRSYTGHPVEPALMEPLLNAIAAAGRLTAVPPRVELISGLDITRRVLTYMIGSYGLVHHAPHLLVGVLPTESDAARVDLGYVLEQAVLQATSLGLGTCWVTGTYDAKNAGEAVGLAAGELAAAVCALGYPLESGLGRLHSQTIRRLAGSRRRKPLAEIVYWERWGDPWGQASADRALVKVLEHARMAPSASNRQPWRFIVRQDGVVLALVGSSLIDAGITMAHIALAAAALERKGRWELRLGDSALADECGLPGGVSPVGVFA